MNTAFHSLDPLLGLHSNPHDLTLVQILLRTAIVCVLLYVMIRVAGRRFLAQKNSLDVLLAFVMASMIARAINGSTNFWGTLAAGLALAAAYRLTTWAACRFHILGKVIKGSPETLVNDGQMQKDLMERYHVSEHDLHEDMRLSARIDDLNKVKIARIERNGEISVERKPQVLELRVEPNVQIIRLLIE